VVSIWLHDVLALSTSPIAEIRIMDDDDVLWTTEQLAEKRNVMKSRIEKERLTGGGPPFIRDGRLIRYRRGDYRQWLAAKRRFTSTSEA
jgi:hypothetical protein